VISAAAKNEVVEEYERLLRQRGLKPGVINIPILSLSRLLDWETEGDFLLINSEKNSTSLLAVVEGQAVLCRQKTSLQPARDPDFVEHKVKNIIQEIDYTANFVEDHEGKNIRTLWIRFGLMESIEEIYSGLRERLALPVKRIEDGFESNLGSEEKRVLSPLIGQLL
jgi:hypothetical protein